MAPTRLRTTIELTNDQAESTLGPGRQRAPLPPPPPATNTPKKSRKLRQQPEDVVSHEDVVVNEAPLVADMGLPPIAVLSAEAEPIPSKRGQQAVPGDDTLPPVANPAEAPPANSHQQPQQHTHLFTAQHPIGWPSAAHPLHPSQTAFPSGPAGVPPFALHGQGSRQSLELSSTWKGLHHSHYMLTYNGLPMTPFPAHGCRTAEPSSRPTTQPQFHQGSWTPDSLPGATTEPPFRPITEPPYQPVSWMPEPPAGAATEAPVPDNDFGQPAVPRTSRSPAASYSSQSHHAPEAPQDLGQESVSQLSKTKAGATTPAVTITPPTPHRREDRSKGESLMGCLSHNEAAALESSIARMEAYLAEELELLSLPQERYLKVWFKNDSRTAAMPNAWNTYEAYFTKHAEEELARLPYVVQLHLQSLIIYC